MPGTSEVGGIEVYALELGEQLQKPRPRRRPYSAANPSRGGSIVPSRFRTSFFDYIETKDIPKLGTRFRKLVQRLHFGSVTMKAFADQQFDAVFVFKPYDFINAWRWKSSQKDLKVVMNYQGTDFFPTDRYWHRWIDREYAVSPENARLAETRYGGTVPVIPNGVDTNFFHPGEQNDKNNVPFAHRWSIGRLERTSRACGSYRRRPRSLLARRGRWPGASLA